MGLKGIENSVTTFTDVEIPAENIIAGVGKGLKIALNTLNTGRLSLPAICVGSTKYALRIVAPVVQASASSGARSSASTTRSPSTSRSSPARRSAWRRWSTCPAALADDKQRDFRIEAAIAKLYGSEMAWQAIDTMVQVRGGRGFETAKSLAARGEKPVPAEQMLRDMRINRTFEGATEIMHLMIAREAVDKHLELAGDILLGDGGVGEKAKLAVNAGKFYAKWFPSLMTGDGQKPRRFDEFGDLAKHLRFAERNSRKLARSTFYAMGRYQAKLEQKGALLGRVVDIGAELYAISAACVYANTIAKEDPNKKESVYELCRPVLLAGPPPRRPPVPRPVGQRRRRAVRDRAERPRGRVRVVRARRPGSRRRRPDDPGGGQADPRGGEVRGGRRLAPPPRRAPFAALGGVSDQPEHHGPQPDEQRAPLGVAALVLVDGLGPDPQAEREADVGQRGAVQHGGRACASRRYPG